MEIWERYFFVYGWFIIILMIGHLISTQKKKTKTVDETDEYPATEGKANYCINLKKWDWD